MKLEYLSRPIYARQTFLLLVFIASLVRFLFMLLQILLPDGLFFLNYLVTIPSICYYSLYTILSCYFNQLYNLFYVSSSVGSLNGNSSTSSTNTANRQNTYTNRIAMISAYFQYTLIFFIPILYMLCIVVYSTKSVTTKQDNGTNSSSTTTTISDNEMNIFQWVYLLFRFILLFSLIYAGSLIYTKIYINSNTSVTLSSSSNVPLSNPRVADSQVIVTRLLIVLCSSAFGITSSIIYGIMNIYGRFVFCAITMNLECLIAIILHRYENWPFIYLVEMYAISEIFPTLIILLHTSKLRLFSTSSTSPPVDSSVQTSKPGNGYGSTQMSVETQNLPTANSRLLPSLNRTKFSNPTYQSIPQQA